MIPQYDFVHAMQAALRTAHEQRYQALVNMWAAGFTTDPSHLSCIDKLIRRRKREWERKMRLFEKALQSVGQVQNGSEPV